MVGSCRWGEDTAELKTKATAVKHKRTETTTTTKKLSGRFGGASQTLPREQHRMAYSLGTAFSYRRVTEQGTIHILIFWFVKAFLVFILFPTNKAFFFFFFHLQLSFPSSWITIPSAFGLRMTITRTREALTKSLYSDTTVTPS